MRENIERFGGDPDNVTLFGESAGGMSVGALLGMPAARGLFRRAIAQSGAAHNVHAEEGALRVAEGLVRALDLEPHTLDKLREVPPQALLEAQTRIQQELRNERELLLFQPAIDAQTLPEAPLEAVRQGAARDVSLLVGTNLEEWNFFGAFDPRVAAMTEDDLRERIVARVGEAGLAPLSVYARTRPDLGIGQRFCAIETDRIFRIPAIRLAEAHATSAGAPDGSSTYSYLFTYRSPALEGRLGSCHALEVPFVFGHVSLPQIAGLVGQGAHVDALSLEMMDAWIGFAREGQPRADWPGYAEGDRATWLFGTPSSVESDPGALEREAWSGLL